MQLATAVTPPLVTVLMSVFNGQSYLGQAVQSILDQSFTDFEFIIVNDGSTDNSLNILLKFAQNDPRIVVIQQANQGLVASLNLGLIRARGSLIARIDADDIAYPQRLEKQVAFMSENLDVVALGSAITLIDESGKVIRQIDYPMGRGNLRDEMMNGSKLAHPSVMMRRKEVLRVGSYREACRHAEDYDLWLRLLEVGELDNLKEPLLYYRQHDNKISITQSFSQRLATQCAKLAFDLRREGSSDPLDVIDLPLRVSSLGEFNLPKKWLEDFYVSLFVSLAKKSKGFSVSERETLEEIFKWIKQHPYLLLKFKVLKGCWRYLRSRLAH